MFKSMLVGQAIAESASIFALVIAVLMLFYKMPGATMIKAASLFGAGLCMGLGRLDRVSARAFRVVRHASVFLGSHQSATG
jgi:F0F1-type ATP synthase membrane subunit c/vacuolar-type H+-ATPase subunit K